MTSKRIFPALLLPLALALGVLGALFWLRPGPNEVADVDTTIASPRAEAPAVKLATPDEVQRATRAVALDGSRPAAEKQTAAEELPRTAPWDGPLAGLTGRIVEGDGTPVVGIQVALLEFDVQKLFVDDRPGAPPVPELELERTATDEEGRFVLGGALAPAFHGLGIDLQGPRAQLRVVDDALAHETRTDLGDIVLAPYGIVTGRIVDEQGVGVPGARVRLGALPEEILEGAPYLLREDSLAAVSMLLGQEGGQAVFEPPPALRHALMNFPVPTTHTDEVGLFRLEGVPLAELVGGVDRDGFAGLPIGPVDLREAAEEDLGELVLPRGRTVEGYAESSEGDPIVDAEVYVGAEVPVGFVAILQPAGRTDEEGFFSCDGVPAEGNVVAVARRTRNDPWVGTVSMEYEDLLIEFAPTVELSVLVRNASGEPLPGAYLELTPTTATDGWTGGISTALQLLPLPKDPEDGFREVEPGHYVHPLVGAGSYELSAWVEGYAPGRMELDLQFVQQSVELVCPEGKFTDVSVVDAATGKPVPEANVRFLAFNERVGFRSLASDVTDGKGLARLGPLAEDPSASEPVLLAVRHPRYAEASTALRKEERELVVELQGGAALAGRIHLGGALPTRSYMLVLEYENAPDDLDLFHLPRIGLSGLDGTFRIANLVAGEYELRVLERFLNEDPFRIASQITEPATVYSENLIVESGQTTEVEIDLTPTGLGATARFHGSVRVEGRALEGVRIQASSNGARAATTDSNGWYDTGDVALRDASVQIKAKGVVGFPCGEQEMVLYSTVIEDVRAGEERRIDIDLYPIVLEVQVMGAGSGAPLPAAEITIRANAEKWGPFLSSTETDTRGNASVCVPDSGQYVLQTSAEGYAQTMRTVELERGAAARSEVFELRAEVPCAGRVSVPATLQQQERSVAFLRVFDEDAGIEVGEVLSPPEFAFDLDGLSEGEYKVLMYVGGEESEELPLVLGPDGDRNLSLPFQPKAQ